MKATVHLFVLVAASAAITMNHTINEINAETICKELDAMKVNISQLLESASPEDVHLCADHPLGRSRTLDSLVRVASFVF